MLVDWCEELTYKKPTKVLSVEIEAELNAEHCVEPESDIQVSAIAPGAAARIESSAVLALRPVGLDLRLLEPFCPLDAIVGLRGDPDDGIISTILALSVDESCIAVLWALPELSSLIFRFCSPPQFIYAHQAEPLSRC